MVGGMLQGTFGDGLLAVEVMVHRR